MGTMEPLDEPKTNLKPKLDDGLNDSARTERGEEHYIVIKEKRTLQLLSPLKRSSP